MAPREDEAFPTGIGAALDKYYGKGAPPAGPNSRGLATRALEEVPDLQAGDAEVLQEMEELDLASLERQSGEA